MPLPWLLLVPRATAMARPRRAEEDSLPTRASGCQGKSMAHIWNKPALRLYAHT